MWPNKKTQTWRDNESNKNILFFWINSIGKRSDDFGRSAENQDGQKDEDSRTDKPRKALAGRRTGQHPANSSRRRKEGKGRCVERAEETEAPHS